MRVPQVIWMLLWPISSGLYGCRFRPLQPAGKRYAEALRGVLNCGYRRGGVASISVGKGTDIEAKDFSTFCAKALAGIGHLPDTVADRSIPIRLKRKAPGEGEVERFHERLVEPEVQEIQERISAWVEPRLADLSQAPLRRDFE
jgi:hypothetical protein